MDYYLLETQQPFSQSLIWDLQHHYFAEKGIEAWRQGEVPHYVTSNPTVAHCYAELVLAFWHDQNQISPSDQSLHLIELGAGSGRFAFHFLDRLTHLCQHANIPLTAFRYILTDIAPRNLNFWLQHPRFQPFFQSGILDLALFDVTHPSPLSLHHSGITLSPGSLQRPPVILANYLFDSIPQDLYYIDDQQCQQCLISLLVDTDPTPLTAAELLPRLHLRYDYQPLDPDAPPDPLLQPLLSHYQTTLTDTHLLLPTTGLHCLHYLRTLSPQGILLLSADKGDHRLEALHDKAPPSLVHHGSFSLNVNYHAFTLYCQETGGIALCPTTQHHSINLIALLLLDQSKHYHRTQHTYQRHVQDFSPDHFYSITKHARQYIARMTVEDILAYLRLSHYDSHQFGRYLPRLQQLAPDFDPTEHQEVKAAIDQVWQLYFPLGEELDLAAQIAHLLYTMGEYADALAYFERSIAIYGPHSSTLYNIALCYHQLDQPTQAESRLQALLQADPTYPPAQALLSGALLSSPQPIPLQPSSSSPDPQTLYHLALYYYEQQHFDLALDYLNQTLDLAPDFDLARALRIRVKAEINRHSCLSQ